MQPWDKEKRARVKGKVDKEADRAKARLGASHVVMIAFFADADGENLHMQDGGVAPMDLDHLYKMMLSVRGVLEASGGEDVAIQ